MDVRKKVGLLALDDSSRAKSPTLEDGVQLDNGITSSRRDKDACALKLWREWASEKLGPMSAEPTAQELNAKSKKIKNLERKCADIAARAQRRLEVSSALRSALAGGLGGAAAWGGSSSTGATGAMLGGSTVSTREMQWAAREARKQAAYDAARTAGEEEHEVQSASPAGNSGARGAHGQPLQGYKSRAMLDALLSGAADAAGSPSPTSNRSRPASARHAGPRGWDAPGAQAGSPGNLGTLSRVGSLSRAPPAPGGLHTSTSFSLARGGVGGMRLRPASASARLLGAGANHAATGGVQGSGQWVSSGELDGLQREIESLRGQLEEARHTCEAQSSLEAQLRDTIDMLRARAHALSSRELEAQRRLQQHQRLEPLFDRLAETFVFKTPEEVVERLEFLEDDKLGSFDQLLRTQEEVVALQAQLADALGRVEGVRTALSTEHVRATGRLQSRNNELRAELEELEHLNSRLGERQEALVALQTAVLELWGRVSDDPAFRAANAEVGMAMGAEGAPGSSTTRGGANGSKGMDPQAVLSLIREYLIAKSPQLASRHYLDMQRVANRVWLQHLQHKPSLRGKVVETFEALSNLADIMAAKIRSIQDQAKTAKANEKGLAEALQKLELQRRALHVALERRDALVRDMSGVPRKERPHSAAAYHGVAAQDDVAIGRTTPSPYSRSGSMRRPPRPHSALSTSPSTKHLNRTTTGTAAALSPYAAHGAVSSHSAHAAAPASPSRQRPVSAPVRRGGSASASALSSAVPAALLPAPIMPDGVGYVLGPLTVIGGGSAAGGARVQVSDKPAGAHWDTLLMAGALGSSGSRPSSARSASGALFKRASTTGMPVGGSGPITLVTVGPGSGGHQACEEGAVAAPGTPPGSTGLVVSKGSEGAAVGGPKWTPPIRASIEASFLTRLERAAAPA